MGTHKDIQLFFGKKLLLARTAAELTQAELAKRISVTSTTIARIERGEQGTSLDVIAALCTELELSPSFFFSAETPPKKQISTKDAVAFVRDALTDPATFDLICAAISSSPKKLK